MLKISRKWSITLSLSLSLLLFLVCIASFFIMSDLTDMLIDTEDNIGNRNEITEAGRAFVHVLAFSIPVVVLLADGLLFALLLRVRAGQVFTSVSVAFVRGVSWCCMLLAVVFCGLGIYFQLSFIVAFAALFLGLCLRVVKNVIEEATAIKSENDLTV